MITDDKLHESLCNEMAKLTNLKVTAVTSKKTLVERVLVKWKFQGLVDSYENNVTELGGSVRVRTSNGYVFDLKIE